MRGIQRIHALFLIVLFIIDLFISSVTKAYLPSSILFISNLHFMGILILGKNDPKETTLIRAIIFGVIMDLIHLDSFPIYMTSYVLSVLIIRMWDRYIGYSVFEFIIMVIIALFLKEFITFTCITLISSYSVSIPYFIGSRIIWVIIGNVILIPVVRKENAKVHMIILKRAENIYLES